MSAINYQTLKQIAKQAGGRVTDLLALAPKNDPFYVGSPATVEAAKWFRDIWQRANFQGKVHFRRVHYWLVNGPLHPYPLPSPLTSKDKATGKTLTFTTYENTERCWEWLQEAGKYARYLGYVSPDAFTDRKNPDPLIFDPPSDERPDPHSFVTDWKLPALELPDPPQLYAAGYEGVEQAYTVEIWAEKTTMNDVLEPLCRRYRLNLVTGAGELTITAVRDFLRRVRKPTRILYVSDFDPAGLGMPISVARKIEFFQRTNGEGSLDIALQPVVLTAEQIQEYQLPRIPVKDSDARKAHFENAYGAGQVELDALEALHPGELAKILEAEILRYIDPDLQHAVGEAEQEYQDELDSAESGVYNKHAAELEELTVEFSEIIPRYKAIKERAEKLYKLIADELEKEAEDIDPAPLPEPSAEGDNDNLLYASDRDYFEQLEAYKARRNGEGMGERGGNGTN
jgi:hypothetical protein